MTVTEAIDKVTFQLQAMADKGKYGSVEASIRPGNKEPQVVLTFKETIQ